jgi:hypothetical protein
MRRPALIEHTRVGLFARCAAICPDTGVEVVVMGPAGGSREALERLAVQKLINALEKRDAPLASAPRKGRLV